MKRLYSFFPALLFSVGFIFYLSVSNEDNYSVASGTASASSEAQSIEDGCIEYEFERLRDPETDRIPDNIRKLELEYASSLPGYEISASSAKFQSLSWKSRGPWNVGGRTRAFAIDISNPSKLLAGSTSGGMWTSTNGGTSWAQNWGSIVHQSVSCIAQDTRAGQTSTWYIGTGEGYGQSATGTGAYYLGNGMYKSTDGGQTWSLLSSTSSNTPQTFDNVWDIIWNTAIDPSNSTSDIVYSATYGAIMRSTNGGTSWAVTKGSASATPFSYFTDVAVSPTGIVYATLSSDGAQKGIYRSTNGTTWTSITPAGFPTTYGRIKIGISPSDENQVYFFAGVTTGAGTPDTNFLGQVEWNSLWKYHHDAVNPKWFDLSPNLPTTGGPFDKQHVQGGYDMVIKVHPTDTATVFLGGTNIYRSSTGFFTPNNTTYMGGYLQGGAPPNHGSYLNHHSDQHEIVFDQANPTIMYNANDGGIYKTTDCMASTVVWTKLNNGYLNSMFYTVALDHAATNDSTIIGGTQDNNSWFINSNDPQAPWVTQYFGDGSYCAITNNKSSYYFSVQNGKMQKMILDAAGNVSSRRRIDPIGGKGYLFINPYILDPNNNDIMYLAGGKNLWRNDALNSITLNGNWDSISTGWTMFPDTVPTANAKISALGISKTPANVLYYGTTSQKVYRVDNANSGTPTATDISTGSGFPASANVSCVAVDPTDANKVLVSFSNYSVYSIFYSANATSASPTWTKVAGNLEQNSNTTGAGTGPSVRWVTILPVSDGTVYVAATSTGLYATSNLNGASTLWVQQGANTIGNSICDMIDARTTDGLVAVATHSHGIFTTHITSINDVLSVNDLAKSEMSLNIYPNPFSSSSTLDFTISKKQKINIGIYDAAGNLVQPIANREFSSGQNTVQLSCGNLASGIYYCRLLAGEISETKKIMITK